MLYKVILGEKHGQKVLIENVLAKKYERSNIHLQTRFYRNLTPHDFNMGNIVKNQRR